LAPTVGIVATGFCYPGGILQLFHRQDQQIFHQEDQQIFHRQDQQILRLPTAASGGPINLQQASKLIFIGKVFITNRPASFIIDI
jgi:hypothetical protein